MTGISDQRLELALREMLEERRPGAASAELRDRVARLPVEVGRPGLLRRLWPAISLGSIAAALAVTAGIALFAIGSLALPPPSADVGASPVAPAQPSDPLIDGPGVLPPTHGAALPLLVFVPWAVAAVAVVVVLRRSDTSRRHARVVAVGVIAASTVAAYALSTHRGFVLGYAVGNVMGIEVQPLPPEAGDDVREIWIVTAGPGEPFAFMVDVRNPGPLPIRLDGVVEEPDPLGIDERWTGLRIHVDPAGGMPGLQVATPFRPIDVPPDGHVRLYVTGRAGRCAMGPSFEGGAEQYTDRSSIRIAYSVLGLSSSAEVEPPFLLAQPLRSGCVAGPVP